MISPERLTHEGEAQRAPRARLGVDSEVGVLRRVILHRPGRELERLTPVEDDPPQDADLGVDRKSVV